MFNPSNDLTAIQNIFITDSAVLNLMNLTGKTQKEILKKIIRKSTWHDLVTGERRLCVYFRASRKTGNVKFTEDVLQVDCYFPADDEFYAYQIQERVKILLDEKLINKRYLYFDGQLGELPTMSGFFCCGSRYCFNRKI